MAGITLHQATTLVEAALRKARESGGAPLAGAVLDDGGRLKAFAREDGAGIIRPQIAMAKAGGALGLGVGSRALARRVAEQPQQQPFFTALSAMSGGRVVPAAGGVLIRDGSGALIRRGRNLRRRFGQGRGPAALAGIEAAKLAGHWLRVLS
ncbi:MAG TPA: heme-binding protein [Methylomirabilota bacterium]|nr:heme-binding protein [Methylomirabilota bacterium]